MIIAIAIVIAIFAQIDYKMKNLVEELQWRGLVHDIMPGTEEQLMKGMTTTYIGFDPTSDSISMSQMKKIVNSLHDISNRWNRFGWSTFASSFG